MRLMLIAWILGALVATGSAAQVPAQLTDSAFGALSAELSEPNGYFDTDNLVSNEDSYLHAVSTLRRLGLSGGAYLGVGPDQNFSYIAAVAPSIAFILDIRRDNLLELQLFKALFGLSRNRLDFLCALFGKQPVSDTTGWGAKSPEALLEYIARAPVDSARALARVRAGVQRGGIALSPADLETIARFHRTFILAGPGLKLTSFGRGERFDYPDFRRLMLERDRNGRQASYLASESAFRVVQSLQQRNLVVPVVGNFAGEKALRAVARYLAQHRERVTAFYTSNVEQYLVQDGILEQFAKNVSALPRRPDGVVVRSYFPYGRPHAGHVDGYLSVQIVQRMDRFLANTLGRTPSYYELVTADIESP